MYQYKGARSTQKLVAFALKGHATATALGPTESPLGYVGIFKGKVISLGFAVQRAFRYLMAACGTKDLLEYTRADALSYRDYLVKKGLAGSSITRVLNTIRPVFNFTISEYALDVKNPFVGIYHNRNFGVSKRLPIPKDALLRIQKECIAYNDELRWLVAIISDSGMRLAEAAGLLKSDLKLDADIPHIVIQPHEWRRLKTETSSKDSAFSWSFAMGRKASTRTLRK